nr:MAG TPA: hypothetical protein [Bacteriophage sp.]
MRNHFYLGVTVKSFLLTYFVVKFYGINTSAKTIGKKYFLLLLFGNFG